MNKAIVVIVLVAMLAMVLVGCQSSASSYQNDPYAAQYAGGIGGGCQRFESAASPTDIVAEAELF